MFKSTIPGITERRIITFVFSFIQYCYIHCCRTTWSYVSGNIAKFHDQNPDLGIGFDKAFLGWINFSFLFFYGVGIAVLGQFGDRMSLKWFVLAGTFSTSIIFTSIGLAMHYELYHQYMFLVLQILNGIAQASAWPGLLSILNNWFSYYKKVILLGCFAACMNVGDIIGDMYCGLIVGNFEVTSETNLEQLEHNKNAIFAAGGSLFLISFMNIFVLQNGPNEEIKMLLDNVDQKQQIISQQKPKQQQDQQEQQEQASQQLQQTQQSQEQCLDSQDALVIASKQPPLTIFSAYLVPGVAIYALAFGCIKGVFYILTFWLPTYLDENPSIPSNDVAWITSMTDVGSIPGGILICVIGFYLNKRAILIVPAVWLGTIVMLVMNSIKNNTNNQTVDSFILVFFTGLFIGGCYNNISAAITVELSNQPQLKNNKQSTSTVVSAIMGYGAMFAAINQIIVSHISNMLFLYCSVLSLIAGLLLIPLIVGEVKRHLIEKKMKN